MTAAAGRGWTRAIARRGRENVLLRSQEGEERTHTTPAPRAGARGRVPLNPPRLLPPSVRGQR